MKNEFKKISTKKQSWENGDKGNALTGYRKLIGMRNQLINSGKNYLTLFPQWAARQTKSNMEGGS